MLQSIIMTAVGFLSGSLMFSYFIPLWLYRVDIRKNTSDNNPGSTNALKAVGAPVGFACMFLDIFKAFAPIFIAVNILNISGLYLMPVIVAPCAGHAFSPFLGWRGGKAVSTLYGSLLALLGISRAVFVVALFMAFFRFVIFLKPDWMIVAVGLIASFVTLLFSEPLPEIKIGVAIISSIICFKIYQNPGKGEVSISVWHYCITYQDNKIRLQRV